MIYARRTQKTEGKGNEKERGRARVQGPRLTTRVYYLPVAMLHLATSVARSNLISLGTCFGKFSKTGKFKLGITSLDWLAKYAKYKVRFSLPPASKSASWGTREDGLILGMGETFWRTPILIW